MKNHNNHKKEIIKDYKKPKNPIGKGNYYHIHVRPKEGYIAFATQDVGKPGGLMRVTGKRSDGVWHTVGWLISKDYAHMSANGVLIITEPKIQSTLSKIYGPIYHQKKDHFKAKIRQHIPERNRWNIVKKLPLGREYTKTY